MPNFASTEETPAGQPSGGHVPCAFVISRREHLNMLKGELKWSSGLQRETTIQPICLP